MKVRLGFVSNSSSTSFMMYGVQVDRDELFDTFKKLPSVCETIDDTDEDFDEYEVCEALAKELGGNLGFWANTECDEYFFGKSWDEVGDNETGKQFKESIVVELKKVFGDNIHTTTHEGELPC